MGSGSGLVYYKVHQECTVGEVCGVGARCVGGWGGGGGASCRMSNLKNGNVPLT